MWLQRKKDTNIQADCWPQLGELVGLMCAMFCIDKKREKNVNEVTAKKNQQDLYILQRDL